ncbi:carbon-phosphorus lyase complex subunit PhnI [Cytobacillus sp. FSL W7-1323]|uniref:Carbon-phosphorus lyase n=1 Tax=Cytobacillus kochii TaxID=859143 RepID=A0A248TI81_9BACI|nr:MULTISPECIES: carbon-phosphorus lyase complex subunit PhnI [Cytobacillus]ASV67881.1 carbon-phosphorus lyase [Cytobacillus kochii]MDQ0185969.1 alpha-D-ribose 1-methylphosphonate 5-triphosphate synthase subunit PhnI [Cytobacillus kochii]MEA1853861.1 carbon-phosphorus lyase complex subunit PhnI [Cytobacillus sp. OWB-43]MED1605174.1 carbon-phosphorus lyase complex subunit PhnI [Cytobacillus kochii]
MGYVAVKGGTEAIEASIERLRYNRLKGERHIEIETILATMKGLVDQVMSEASLYAPMLAALAIKQSEGNMEEAVFTLRAHRSTLPRLYYSEAIQTEDMRISRRISSSFKDIPGGQILGATTDYTHRLLDFDLLIEDQQEEKQWLQHYKERIDQLREQPSSQIFPKVVEYLRENGLVQTYVDDNREPFDVTKKSLQFPANRSARLQTLTRGQTGAVISLGYASMRGYGQVHPNVGELRVGMMPIHISSPHECEEEQYYIGAIEVTEVESFVPVKGASEESEEALDFEIGYGMCYGQNETKAIAMSILDQCLQHPSSDFPTHDEEFVLLHIDSVESTGFISHLKLPHYVTFQSKLDRARKGQKGE